MSRVQSPFKAVIYQTKTCRFYQIKSFAIFTIVCFMNKKALVFKMSKCQAIWVFSKNSQNLIHGRTNFTW